MRISTQWLSDWVAPVPPARELAQRLTMAGLEIEAIEPATPPLVGIVVGEIIDCVKHPDADTLSVCTVAAGAAGTLQVVCGAPNARVGLKAPLATVGAKLPGGIEIRKAQLRGIESAGMLCSARELGLADDASGLLELPAELPTGAALGEALALDDTILEVNLTPNRGDCMSMLGIAREVAVLTGAAMGGPELRPVAAGVPDRFPIELEPGAGCPRFASRVVRGLRPGAQAPLWMRERLRRAGIRSIAAAVDVTNYVMLELGQPMHAYDLSTLEGALVVRRARAGETLTLLDGRTVNLEPDVLVIADRAKLLGLAGVMGGEGSGITYGTTDVLLEVAHFRPDAIAGRGRRFGLVTDASQRFERGVDPTLQGRALERATELLLACAGGQAGPAQLAELSGEISAMPRVRLRWSRARMVIGADVEDGRMRRILAALGMDLDADGADAAWITPPPWRFDIAIEEDLIEEIARVEGFDAVPERPGVGLVRMPPNPEAQPHVDAVADRLVQRGYHEAITYSFVDPRLQSLLFPGEATMALANPISADLAVMRLSLWPGLLKACADNQRHQQPRVRLFETGRRFTGTGDDLREVTVVAGVVAGAALPEQWGGPARDVDFFDLKGDVEALLRMSGDAQSFLFEPAEHPALHPGQSARVLRDGAPVGWIGRVHPRVTKSLDLSYAALVFELDLDLALAARIPKHRETSRFPAVRRDLAFVVDESVSMWAIEACIRGAAGALLTDLVVFDLYRGVGIEPGRKSVATGLILQDVSRTLTEQDIEAVVVRVASDLGRECNATIRDK